MSNAVIESVRALGREVNADTLAEYWRLVRRSAEGDQSVDPEQVVLSVADLGRSLEQFQADAELVEQRIGWSATAAKIPELKRESARLDAAIAERRLQFEDYVRGYEQDMDRLREQHSDVSQGLIQADGAHRRLVETAAQVVDPAILDEREAIAERVRSAMATIAASQSSISRLRGNIQVATADRERNQRAARGDSDTVKAFTDSIDERIRGYQDRLAEQEARLAAAEADLRQANRRTDEILQLLLKP
jgi:chromosome segregation ATPase